MKLICVLVCIYMAQRIAATYNETCGCKLWMCNEYEYNTTEYENCATSDGCIYCQLCSESQPDCSCDTQSICNITDTTTKKSTQRSSSSWWTLSIFCMLILSAGFIFVIALQYYKITHNDHEFKLMTIQRRMSAADGLVEKAKELQNWLDIKDRKWHFRKYQQCFIGKAAVKCMVDLKFVADEKEAINFGNKLIQFNIIEHVEQQHAFRNEHLFYRFVDGFGNRNLEQDDMRKIWTSCLDTMHSDSSQKMGNEKHKDNDGTDGDEDLNPQSIKIVYKTDEKV